MKCLELNLLFMDICKNAGSSIIASFENAFPDYDFEGKHHSVPNWRLFYKHFVKMETCSDVSPEDFSQYRTFSVVRNPYDRLVSLFLWNEKYSPLSFYEFLVNIAEGVWEFEAYRYRPQIDWFRSDGELIMPDHILRYENLETDFVSLLKDLNIKPFELLHINKAQHHTGKPRKPYAVYYDQKSKELATTLFSTDLECFNYRF